MARSLSAMPIFEKVEQVPAYRLLADRIADQILAGQIKPGEQLPPEISLAEQFGVLALGGLYARRWTFYIDDSGIVRHIDKDVSPASHGQDVARQLGELGFPLRSASTSDSES